MPTNTRSRRDIHPRRGRAAAATPLRRLALRVGLLLAVASGLVPPPVAQAGDLEILEYRLSLRLELVKKGVWAPLNTLSGKARITFRNAGDSAAPRVPVVLNRLMKLQAARTGSGQALHLRQGLVALEGWDTYQANAATVTLEEPIDPGDSFTLELDYAGGLSGYQESGMLYVQESLDPEFTIIRPETSSYPLLAEPTKESVRRFSSGSAPFDQLLQLTVPEGLVVASGHELVEQRQEEGWVTWVYRSRAPAFQIVLPVAPYEVIEQGRNRIYHFPQDREGARRVAQGIADALELLTRWFGPLQDRSSFAVAEIPEWYGSQALRPTILQTASAFREASAMFELYHEISHFWNVDDPAPNASRWNEGAATYLQELVAGELENEPGRLERRLNEYSQRLRKHLEEHPEHRRIPLIRAGEENATSALSYSGGGLFFGLLHHRLGQGPLLSILKDYYQRFHESGATSQEFAEFLSSRAPRARRILNEWFLEGTYSDLLLEGLDFDALVDRYAAG